MWIERIQKQNKKEYGISFCGVRLCHTLGPGIVLDDGRGFAEFMDCVLNDKDIVLTAVRQN